MPRLKTRKRWIKIHRYVGLFSAFFLLLIALTGLLLSFSKPLNLEAHTPFWQKNALQIASHNISLEGDQVLFDGKNTNIRCISPIAGIASTNIEGIESVMLACQNVLYWLTWDADAIDSINVPAQFTPISKAFFDESLILKTPKGLVKWDTMQTSLEPTNLTSPNRIPLNSIDAQGSNLAQWVLNLHTGLVAGDIGRWLMRLAGLGLLLLCFSGLKNALRIK